MFLDQWGNYWTSSEILYEMLDMYQVSTRNENYMNLIRNMTEVDDKSVNLNPNF